MDVAFCVQISNQLQPRLKQYVSQIGLSTNLFFDAPFQLQSSLDNLPNKHNKYCILANGTNGVPAGLRFLFVCFYGPSPNKSDTAIYGRSR